MTDIATTHSRTVARRDTAAKEPSAAEIVRLAIERQTPALAVVMPKGLDSERFSRLVLTAVKATPQLMECFGTQQGQVSVLLAAMQLATVGLEPNTATQDAWITPRRQRGVMEAQATIGYRGLLKLARRSGDIKTVYAEVVRDGDDFTWSRGLDEDTLVHIPGDDDTRPLTHAYAVVRYTNGGNDFVVLTRRQIEKRRDMSDSWRNEKGRQYSPWSQWTEAMWCKTALRELAKRMPLTAQAATALNTDEHTLTVDADAGIIPATIHNNDDDTPALEPPADIDADTGEIVEVLTGDEDV